MRFSEVINSLTVEHSGYAIAKKLGVTPSTFYRWRDGKKIPSDEILEKMAVMANLNKVDVFLAAYAERVDDPEVREHFRKLAAH